MSTPETWKKIEQSKQRRLQQPLQASDTDHHRLSSTANYYNGQHQIDFTDDRAFGRQYTSFEAAKKHRQQLPNDINVRVQHKLCSIVEVKEISSDVPCFELTVCADKLICFFGRDHWLSNLYRCSINIDGHDYPTVEHYYQACKLYTLGGARMAIQVRRIPDAGNVKVTARRLLRGVVDNNTIDEWKRTKGPHILHHAIVNKFVQNVDLRQKLIASGDSILAHTYEMDKFFATGCSREKLTDWAKLHNGESIKFPRILTDDTIVNVPLIGDGKNILGVINMQVREQVRKFESNRQDGDDPIMAAAMAVLKLNTSDATSSNAHDVDGAA